LETWFFVPIQGELVQKGWIPLVTTKFKKFALKVFERILKECEQGSFGYTIEIDPKLAA